MLAHIYRLPFCSKRDGYERLTEPTVASGVREHAEPRQRIENRWKHREYAVPAVLRLSMAENGR
ncbi:hypothetical protein [Allorhodopirellula solitaria]|uniref:hypothetical protein n=1 Tax=Allorhodopirellula solitaria TaxID=2527987 RepID=UPI0011B71D89|nr:hypothetical protein [Allorhodopirellula solitaria]